MGEKSNMKKCLPVRAPEEFNGSNLTAEKSETKLCTERGKKLCVSSVDKRKVEQELWTGY